MPQNPEFERSNLFKNPDAPLFVLVDGYSLLFRAFYSMGEMNAPDGVPTGALFGLTNMLIKAVEDHKPDYLLVAFDAHGPTFRHERYKEYKSHRDEAPEELKLQFPIARELVDALGMDHEELLGFEADDVIGTMAKQAEKEGWNVLILTGDSDLGQLVSDKIAVIQSLPARMPDRALTPDKVRERYGIPEPINLVDYKGLVGDSSDNIPGVKGVGEKTAKILLEKFPTVEQIYEHIGEIEEKYRKKLEPGEESARLSKELATILTDLPLKINSKSAERFHYDLGHIDKEKASELFTRLGFKSTLKRLELHEAKIKDELKTGSGFKTVIVDTPELLEDVVKILKKAKRFAFDFETTDLDSRTADMVGLACSVDGKTGWYIPVGHNISITDTHKKQLPVKDVVAAFKPLWENEKIEKICQNGKFEWLHCLRYGVELKGLVDDPMIADYVIAKDQRHGLKEMALRELGMQMTPIEELIGSKGKSQMSMADVPIDKVAPYASADSVSTYLLAGKLRSKFETETLSKLYDDVEMQLVPILARMEAVGIKLDAAALDEVAVDLDRRMADISSVIYQEIGYEVNLNSPKQLAEVLFDKMKLPKVRGMSTDAAVLEKLAIDHELPQMILEYRTLAKLRGTYTTNLIDLIDKKDGRIHTSYNQTVTSTGRLSSANPNLQNIPIRTELGRGIRKAFKPNHDGEVLLSADYSQIELRLLAHFTEDPVLVNAYKNDEDIHARTAMEVFDVTANNVTPEMRRGAKVINFGIVYGMGPDGLSKALKKSRTECKAFIDRFFERYPGVKGYMEHTKKFGRENGYVETILGRRAYYPDLNSSNGMMRAAAERAATNMPLQGSAADIIKLAMVQLQDKLEKMDLPESMLLQVHDELVLSVPENKLGEISEVVGCTMSGIRKLHVPMIVNCKAGPNWLDMAPAGDYRSD